MCAGSTFNPSLCSTDIEANQFPGEELYLTRESFRAGSHKTEGASSAMHQHWLHYGFFCGEDVREESVSVTENYRVH